MCISPVDAYTSTSRIGPRAKSLNHTTNSSTHHNYWYCGFDNSNAQELQQRKVAAELYSRRCAFIGKARKGNGIGATGSKSPRAY